MKKSSADRNFNTCAGTTTDDSVIRDLRHQGQVFATDSILSTLMCASRSVNPWDIIVRRIGNKDSFFNLYETFFLYFFMFYFFVIE